MQASKNITIDIEAKIPYRTRFTKFPYVFWAFGKEKKFLVENGRLKIEDSEQDFIYSPLGKAKFYAIKYIVPLIIFAVIFRPYDFYLTDKFRFLSHVFSIGLVTILTLSTGVIKNILIVAGMAIVVGVSFYLDVLSVISFVVKYVAFYYVFLMMFVDKDFNAYSVIHNGNVVSNFVIRKSIDNLNENGSVR